MEGNRVKVEEAAKILQTSPQFVRVAMQKGKLPIGTCFKMSTQWTYYINEKMLEEFTGLDVHTALQEIRRTA